MNNNNTTILWGVKVRQNEVEYGGYEEIAFLSGLYGDEALQFYSFHDLKSYLHNNLNLQNNSYLVELEKCCDLYLLCDYINQSIDIGDGYLEYYRKVSEYIVPGAVFITEEDALDFISSRNFSGTAYPYEIEIDSSYSNSLYNLIMQANTKKLVKEGNEND